MSTAVPDMAPWRRKFRDSRALIVLELLLVVAVFVLDHLLYLGTTPLLLALGWSSMAIRGVRWGDVGFRLDPRWLVLVFIGVIGGVVIEAVEQLATQPWFMQWTGAHPHLSNFRGLAGKLDWYVLIIAASWFGAGFAQDLAWRGYLMNRLSDLLGHGVAGWTATLVLVGAAFALTHAQQGAIGIGVNFVDCMLLGLLYLATGRNLIAPIVAHGVAELIDCLLVYSGHFPGL